MLLSLVATQEAYSMTLHSVSNQEHLMRSCHFEENLDTGASNKSLQWHHVLMTYLSIHIGVFWPSTSCILGEANSYLSAFPVAR